MMDDSNNEEPKGLTRREALKISGLALGGLTAGGAVTCAGEGTAQADDTCTCTGDVEWTGAGSSKQYSYYQGLPKFHPVDSIHLLQLRGLILQIQGGHAASTVELTVSP
jgi:ribonuclease Z